MTRAPTEGDRLDRYQLTRLVASSGPLSIFQATDTDTGATVALRVPSLPGEDDLELFERLRREEETGHKLDHPNLVKVFAPPGRSAPYVVMEYVAGETLRSILQREKQLPIPQALSIAKQLCAALAYLHGHGIAHRNLKPENLIVTALGEVKLIGLAFALDQSARRLTWTSLSPALGQAEYLAPEQVAGKRGNERSDLYGVGVLLYEMLCGQVPHPRKGSGASPVDLARTFEAPRAPRQLRSELGPALERLILTCLERAPGDRPDSALELLRALDRPEEWLAARSRTRILAGRPVLAVAVVAAILGGLLWLTLHS